MGPKREMNYGLVEVRRAWLSQECLRWTSRGIACKKAEEIPMTEMVVAEDLIWENSEWAPWCLIEHIHYGVWRE